MSEVVIDLDPVILRITKPALEIILNYVQIKKNSFESGGVLVGLVIDNYSYIITDASEPTKFDSSGKFFFNRSKNSAQHFIKKLFKKSVGKKIYFGEWHTHPENYPSPSKLDINSIKKQIGSINLNSDKIFMIIVGIKKIYIGLYSDTGQFVTSTLIKI